MQRSSLFWLVASALLGGACSGAIDGGEPAPAGPSSTKVPTTRPPAGGATTPGDTTDPTRPPGGGVQPPVAPLAPGMATCAPGGDGAAPRRLHRLSATQFKNSLAVLVNGRQKVPRPTLKPPVETPGLFDEKSTERFTTFAGAASVIDLDASASQEAAATVADQLVGQWLKDPASCLATGKPAFGECLKPLVADKGALLFRRPLTVDEVNAYVAIGTANAAALGTTDAAALVVQLLIVSPYSLFRVETGQGTPDADGLVKLSPYEVASALSLALTDFPPDETLWAAAQNKGLETPEQIAAQVERLVGNLGENDKLRTFVREYFHYGDADATPKDSKLYPFHDGAQLKSDTDALVVDLLGQQGRKDFLRALLTTPVLYAQAKTAASYGLKAVTTTTPSRQMAPAGQRAGLLTQPSFLVAFSDMDDTQPVHRGRFVRESLLCGIVPALPISSVPPLPDLGANATMRERLKVHSTTPGCGACHDLMDPLGLGFEGFDHVGRVRTSDAGNKPVDASGVLTGAGAVDGPFNGAVELSNRLASSPVVRQCFARHLFRYLAGRSETASDACAIARADQRFAEGGDLLALVSEIVASRPFRYRRVAP